LQRLLTGIRDELRLAMALTGLTRIDQIGPHCLDPGSPETKEKDHA